MIPSMSQCVPSPRVLFLRLLPLRLLPLRELAFVVLSMGAMPTLGVAPTLHLSAQEAPEPIRLHVGGEILVASPVGEFAENVASGFGLGGHARFSFEDQNILGLRIDMGFLTYGNETIRICVTQPCRVTGDLTTSNNIFFGGIGPELGVGGGSARAYANASAGFAYFWTSSSVEGSSNQGDPFASSTNYQDATFAWMASGGTQFRISAGTSPVYLDLGARYHGNGEAQYLRKGDITDRPDGSVEINPRRSETNFWTFRLGITVGIAPEALRDERR